MTKEQIISYDVTVTDNCGYCKETIKLLDRKQVSYEVTTFSESEDDQQILNFLKEERDWKTVPIILGVLDNGEKKLIGGFEELKELLE